MGDSGEGLIDNEARIQERMEELQRNRAQLRKPPIENPELTRQIESLQLARKEMVRSIESTVHEARRTQLTAALADVDRRIAALQSEERNLDP
jgi:chromosome segregation ATPase